MTLNKTLYHAEGTIKVAAEGYWYSNGGIKGSFGYYPHLKDSEGFPVFPDTQVVGNLKTAVKWYGRLSSEKTLEPLIDKVFGHERASDSALLKTTDLVLTSDSKKGWRDIRDRNFQIKTRIKINPETKTVEKYFLVDLELSFLEGFELESKIYLGYFTDPEAFSKAKSCLENAVHLLPGFGAFRSRGFGRGKVSLEWNISEAVVFNASDLSGYETGDADLNPYSFNYYLTSLVNMRSKLPGSGSLQHIESMNHISVEQLRAWFVNTWHTLFGVWPDYQDLGRIKFQSMYPGDSSRNILYCPAPVSTLIDENKKINDRWEKSTRALSETDKEERDEQELENYVRTKTKPLSADYFVTRDAENHIIEVIKLNREKRIRNRLDDHFITNENSLFVQEFIPQGSCFGTTIAVHKPQDSDPERSGDSANANLLDELFSNKVLFILKNVKPVIKGTVFSPIILPLKEQTTSLDISDENPDIPYLVIKPIPYTDKLIQTGNAIRISSTQNYNTVLKRHKRNRIIIEPSSVIAGDHCDSYNDFCIAWNGFNKNDIPCREAVETKDKYIMNDEQNRSFNKQEMDYSSHQIIRNISKYVISNSQAGLLRELLNKNSGNDIERNLEHRFEKYSAKSEKKLPDIIKAINEELKKNGADSMRMLIRHFLESLAVEKWKTKSSSKTENKQGEKRG